MSQEIFVETRDLDIHFPIYSASAKSLRHLIVSAASAGRVEKARSESVISHALNKINIRLNGGDRVGLIGSNGAGKSTLLRTIAGIYEPTSGTLETSHIPMLIADLGVGFDEDAPGSMNIYLANMIRGISREKTDAVYDSIVEFSGLGDAISMPLRTYSAGMRMRLAFSIAVADNPSILLIDEVFGAGDASFIGKSVARMEELIGSSEVFMFASHSNDLMRKFCDKCIYLKNGHAEFFGDIDQGLELYSRDNNLEGPNDVV